MPIIDLTADLPVAHQAVTAWHGRPGAEARLVPPFEAGRSPVSHTLSFVALDADRCRVTDRVEKSGDSPLLDLLGMGPTQRQLEQGFRYRCETIRDDVEAHERYADQTSRTVLVTGASGVIGRALVPFLTAGGHTVRRLVRRPPGHGEIRWDPDAGQIAPSCLDGVDVVIHLSGESIAAGRWTEASKRRVLESRIRSTTLLSETMARHSTPPAVLVAASAVGIYGNRGDTALDESTRMDSASPTTFLERVGRAWEAATAPARRVGTRVVNLRIGVVLTPAGGALAAMLPAFQVGLAGRLGDGRQFMSWITIDDLLGAIHHAMFSDSLQGAVNATAPEPVRNADFTRTLAGVLGRPAFLPVPAPALQLLLGQMGEELLLASTRVVPERLLASGYRFRHPGLEAALRHVLGRSV
jgi:uncharacterized protein (TIGR01777 family)